MPSTRTNLTAAFVAGLTVVSAGLALTFWTVRNAAIYEDIGQTAKTEGDLAAALIVEAGEEAQRVVIGPDTSRAMIFITPRLGARLNTFPGDIIVLDRRGAPLFRSTRLEALPPADSALLEEQIPNLRAGGPALLLSLSAGERLLLVARDIASPSG